MGMETQNKGDRGGGNCKKVKIRTWSSAPRAVWECGKHQPSTKSCSREIGKGRVDRINEQGWDVIPSFSSFSIKIQPAAGSPALAFILLVGYSHSNLPCSILCALLQLCHQMAQLHQLCQTSRSLGYEQPCQQLQKSTRIIFPLCCKTEIIQTQWDVQSHAKRFGSQSFQGLCRN